VRTARTKGGGNIGADEACSSGHKNGLHHHGGETTASDCLAQ
jgi:hypothetical protein